MLDEYVFPHNTIPFRVVQNQAKLMRYYMKRIPKLNMRKESTPNRYKISLYAFKDFAFTRAAKKFDIDFARELKGDRRTQYSNYTIEEKKEMYRELEPELTIFNADTVRKELTNRYSDQEKTIKELQFQQEKTNLTISLKETVMKEFIKSPKTKGITLLGRDGEELASVAKNELLSMKGW